MANQCHRLNETGRVETVKRQRKGGKRKVGLGCGDARKCQGFYSVELIPAFFILLFLMCDPNQLA